MYTNCFDNTNSFARATDKVVVNANRNSNPVQLAKTFALWGVSAATFNANRFINNEESTPGMSFDDLQTVY